MQQKPYSIYTPIALGISIFNLCAFSNEDREAAGHSVGGSTYNLLMPCAVCGALLQYALQKGL